MHKQEVEAVCLWSTNFLKESSKLQPRAFFHNLARISRKTDWIFVKTSQWMYVWTRKSLISYPGHPDSESGLRCRMDLACLCWPSAFVSMC